MDDAVANAVKRGELTHTIKSCTRCDLRERCKGPVPFRGPSPNRLMIVGEAPGGTEDIMGKPFVGPSGSLLTRVFRDVRLPDPSLWFIANVVSCRSVGPPTREQVVACSSNLRAQVKLCNPEWVLLLGATALASTGYLKGKISQIHGRWFACEAGPFKDVKCWATFHPAAGLREQKRVTEIVSDLAAFESVLSGRVSEENYEVKVSRGKVIVL